MPDRYGTTLSALREAGLWRTHHVRESSQSRFVDYQGKRYLNFNSNDYLGLSADPRLMEAAIAGMRQFGLGSGAANTLSGFTAAHEALCDALSKWLGRDKVLLFSSGYQANLAMLSSLVKPSDFIAADKHNHASLIDGMRMSGARFKRYAHVNVNAAQKCLPHDGTGFIVTESVFSMEGDAADLRGLSDMAHQAHATLLIDEAHAFGLYGPTGQGCVAAQGLTQEDVPVVMGTFGKALGVSGAMLAGRADYIDMIMQSARPYLFTTAISPMIASAVTCAVDCVQKSDAARAHLRAMIHYFRDNMQSLGVGLYPSDSPIQSWMCTSIEAAQQIGDALKAKHIWVPVIRYPTVPIDKPRLRFTLTALHTQADIDTLLTAIQEVCHGQSI